MTDTPASGPKSGLVDPEVLLQEELAGALPWSVILHDDQLHTYEYVIEMLTNLTGMDMKTALQHALEVDTRGMTVVAQAPRPEAERLRDAIMTYGGDPRMRTTISMVASVELND